MTIIEQILQGTVRLSYSALHHFMKSPEHFIQYKTDPRKDTDATIFGKAYHCYVLQNNKFDKKFAVLDESKRPDPLKDYRTKINKEWKDLEIERANQAGIILISQEYLEKIKVMAEKLYFHQPSKELLEYTRAKFESEINFERKGIEMKSFIDIQADVFLADLKTTQDAYPPFFAREIYNYGYDLQTAVYNDADSFGHTTFKKLKEFYFIAQEKTAPYGISIHKFGEKPLQFAFEEYLQALDNFNECLKDPELFMRTYDYYSKDQINKVFNVEIPYFKTVLD